MPLLISALWAAIQLLPFSSQRQWDPFVSCQHKHPVIGGPEDVQYWISAVLPHTALAITKEGSESPRGSGCWISCSWIPNTQISSCSSVANYTDFERRRAEEGQAKALRAKWQLGCMWQVDPSWMTGATKAALSLPSSAGQGGKKKTKVSWVKGREKSFANDHHGQKRLHLGKLISCQSNQSRVTRNESRF